MMHSAHSFQSKIDRVTVNVMLAHQTKGKGALSSALLRAKRSLEVTAIATSNVLFLALGNAAGFDLPAL